MKDSSKTPKAAAPADAVVEAEAPVAVAVPAEASPKAPVTALPSSEPPLMPAERVFVASKADPIVAAFLHTERLRPGGVRKMTRAAWLAELDTFKTAPRG